MVKKYSLYLFVGFLVCSCSSNDKNNGVINETIYINNQSDFDEYKNQEFGKGAKILFSEGTIFNGQFTPTGRGTEENPIIVAAYNPDSGEIYEDYIDNKPVINGQGNFDATFFLKNGQYWEISNLEITNTNGSDEDQGDLRGIHVVTEDIGVARHIVVKNCYVHDVNGMASRDKQEGGIHFNVYGDDINTRFHDVQILNNVVSNVGGVGIANQSSHYFSDKYVGEEGFIPWTGLIIRGNRIEDTSHNSIIFRFSKNPIVEYNVSARSSLTEGGHSIVNFNTIDAVMQYNEAYENTGAPEGNEHGGFDADYHSRGTVIQYNYSHDNHWFCGIMRNPNTDVTVRYNISQNELIGSYLYGFPEKNEVEDVKVYNNVHYFGKGIADPVIFVGRGAEATRSAIETKFRNNIWYSAEGQGTIGEPPDESSTFENNLFYNFTPLGTNYITEDPMFVDPGKGGTDIDMKAPDRLSGYQLQANSPAIDAGVEIENNGGQDFWGNSLYNTRTDLGAHEYQ